MLSQRLTWGAPTRLRPRRPPGVASREPRRAAPGPLEAAGAQPSGALGWDFGGSMKGGAPDSGACVLPRSEGCHVRRCDIGLLKMKGLVDSVLLCCEA